MIKRTVEISEKSAHLSVELDQLLIRRHDQNRIAGRIPCEDIGLVLVDHPETTYSHRALAKLVDFGGGLVVCGRDHLPAGLLLPMSNHTQVVWRIHDQIAASKPLRKGLWKQIVQAKVRAQAENLPTGTAASRRLCELARQVRSGDPTNVEAQAAKVYWPVWHATLASSDGDGEQMPVSFRRDPDGKDALNAMLNYGYAVVRAAIARAMVGAGLLPALGIHHANRSNAFCLADDLLEPLRPMVDRRVRELHGDGLPQRGVLDRPSKAGLLKLLTAEVRVEEQSGPLMVCLHRMVASLVRCFEGSERRLLIPRPVGKGGGDGGRSVP